MAASPAVAALYVDPRGPYPKLLGPELCWDEERDARLYPGPWPVVAHPPCERWGRYWHGGPNSEKFPRERKRRGDDGGCFAAALHAVHQFGGVLEHPADSSAWDSFGLIRPPRTGGWVSSGFGRGWSCCVEQGHYGHRARKATWLYAFGVSSLPSLEWGPSAATAKLDEGFHSAEERARTRAVGFSIERLSKLDRKVTPLEFAQLLISIARQSPCSGRGAA